MCEDSAILFYMKGTNESLERQVLGNLKQARGYHRLWAKKEPRFAFRGVNRYGEECYAPYDSIKQYLVVLVVSSECGIFVVDPLPAEMNHGVIVIPDKLLHWIADFGGTIVDVLRIIYAYLSVNVPQDDPSDAFVALRAAVEGYIFSAHLGADLYGENLTGRPREDYNLLHKYLSAIKQDSNGRKESPSPVLDEMNEFFSEMCLLELCAICSCAETAIKASIPPRFERWVLMRWPLAHRKVFVGVISLGRTNMDDFFDAQVKAGFGGEGGDPHAALIIYANVADINDYRSPFMFLLPAEKPPRQSRLMLAAVIEEISS